jgi:RNA polymerase sigma factor (sigma-70 family)
MLNHTMTAEILLSMRLSVGREIGTTHESDVGDCVQDACVRAWSNLEAFDASKGTFKTWCCTIAKNVAKNWRKASANRGHDSVGRTDEDGEAAPLVDTLIGEDGRAEALRTMEAEWLGEALATLPDDERAFIRSINQGMGQTEAGALVGWSPATATRRRKAIAEKLAKLR